MGHEDLLVVERFLRQLHSTPGGLHPSTIIRSCRHTISTNVPGQSQLVPAEDADRAFLAARPLCQGALCRCDGPDNEPMRTRLAGHGVDVRHSYAGRNWSCVNQVWTVVVCPSAAMT